MNRKATTLAAGIAAILATAAFALAGQAAYAANVNIDIVPGASTKTNDAFSSNPAEAHVGDTVVWTNKDGALHTVESGSSGAPDGKFGTKPDKSPELIPPGKTLEFKPTQAGDYPYFCSLHPAMVGTLKVTGS
ncbi:cupredoxin domain-containing protein [Nitrososphaera viennensis]|uniref:Plastocyanin/azurin family copper-binding protein n=2 Tax=Nitrososphaera viennensis TaxID=1034015 RepID=A0A977IER6_9ARCH|nr:plastocyanin/azurin family copper-binding protein [Nitrososphaera viennensis]AIC14730.1 Putative copper-binding, plastocyanin/azurin family protein [Nitrososphaera viennensis EN76]UVS69691.1 plastocyanin/azurin family copper-binding protein [Nitrososphaera viennensis]